MHDDQTTMSRRDLVRLGGLLVALLAVTGVLLLVTGGGGGSSSLPAATMEGVLKDVTRDRLVLQPSDGSPATTFEVRPEDARRLDLFHLQQHSSQGLSTIVTYERKNAKLFAVAARDA